MKLKIFFHLLLQTVVLFASANTVFADNVSVTGSIKHTLKHSNSDSSIGSKTATDKVIQLLHVQLSDAEKELLKSRVKEVTDHTRNFSLQTSSAEHSELPNHVQLDMNKVPVLDQGIHGTCVTFAVTGALDAVIGKGDYVSQLCHLQLGTYLEKNGFGHSGWNGSYAINVINQIELFGIINIADQRKQGCGGMKSYPTNSMPKSFMEPEQFSARSELVFGKVVNWSDVYQRSDAIKTLSEVKESLNSGDRLVFAVLLPRVDLGTAGAVGKYKTWFYKDTWLLTPEILKGVDSIEAAHEMIITGYDDEAEAVDNNGKKHKGLLKLRNSWGTSIGDDGEFYMSYDYFKLLSFDVKRISPYTLLQIA